MNPYAAPLAAEEPDETEKTAEDALEAVETPKAADAPKTPEEAEAPEKPAAPEAHTPPYMSAAGDVTPPAPAEGHRRVSRASRYQSPRDPE